MSLKKFIKLSYKYYKGSADTKPDLKEVFGFIHELDKTRSKKIQMQWQQYPVAVSYTHLTLPTKCSV